MMWKNAKQQTYNLFCEALYGIRSKLGTEIQNGRPKVWEIGDLTNHFRIRSCSRIGSELKPVKPK